MGRWRTIRPRLLSRRGRVRRADRTGGYEWWSSPRLYRPKARKRSPRRSRARSSRNRCGRLEREPWTEIAPEPLVEAWALASVGVSALRRAGAEEAWAAPPRPASEAGEEAAPVRPEPEAAEVFPAEEAAAAPPLAPAEAARRPAAEAFPEE